MSDTHDMEISKIEFLAEDDTVITFYCPICKAVIEIYPQEDDPTVNVRFAGNTEVEHRGVAVISLVIDFAEITENREFINDILEGVNLD